MVGLLSFEIVKEKSKSGICVRMHLVRLVVNIRPEASLVARW